MPWHGHDLLTLKRSRSKVSQYTEHGEYTNGRKDGRKEAIALLAIVVSKYLPEK